MEMCIQEIKFSLDIKVLKEHTLAPIGQYVVNAWSESIQNMLPEGCKYVIILFYVSNCSFPGPENTLSAQFTPEVNQINQSYGTPLFNISWAYIVPLVELHLKFNGKNFL